MRTTSLPDRLNTRWSLGNGDPCTDEGQDCSTVGVRPFGGLSRRLGDVRIEAMQQRLPSLIDPITFAHRGARAYAPENTIEAFNLGLRLGASGLESDVWVTADGVAVLDHDGVVRRRGRKIPISDVLRVNLPEHIPSLEEMLDSCAGEYNLSLDVKDPGAFAATLRAIRSAKPDIENRTWLCHHDWRLVAQWRSSTSAKLVDSTRLGRIKEGPERRLAQLTEAGIDCLNMHHTDWSGGLVTLAHRFERFALGWDMQFDHIIENGLRMGLDGVFSDYPDRMVEASTRVANTLG
jgi:glycerophosphoryl diester phosphodiesterase